MIQSGSLRFLVPSHRAARLAGRAAALAGAAAAAVGMMAIAPGVDGLVREGWTRQLEMTGSEIPRAFHRSAAPVSTTQAAVSPAATEAGAPPPQNLVLRDVVVGDRVTLVAPDGKVYVLRICEGRAEALSANVAPTDCLRLLPVKLDEPVRVSVPQRSL